MRISLPVRSGIVSFLVLATLLVAWQLAVSGTSATTKMDPEYAKLMGAAATTGKSAMPGPLEVGAKLWELLSNPFYDKGPNDKGIGIQLAYSIARVGTGYILAAMVAIPLGFWIGMSPLMSRAE
jgi:nitrate/nitrite transport system permease protein